MDEWSPIARAHHDLNGITEIVITGWTGPHAILPHIHDDEHGVTIRVPQRVRGEYWTFPMPRDGVLTCFTSLLGSPSLLGPTDMTMAVHLPAHLIGDVKVTFAAPVTATAQDDPEVARIVRNMDLLAGGPETDPFA